MATPPHAPTERGQIVKDPEVVAMATIGKLLPSLTPDAQQRILAWLVSKYGIKPSDPK